jgi:putative spermidine/putrescine transport system permease protein
MDAIMSSQDWQSRELKRSLRHVNVRKQLGALALIGPLAVFILLVFLLPVASMLMRSVENPEVVDALPATTQALRQWDRKSLVPDEAFRGIMLDIERNGVHCHLAKRMQNFRPPRFGES